MIIAVGTGRCGTMTMFKFFRHQGWDSKHESIRPEEARTVKMDLPNKKKFIKPHIRGKRSLESNNFLSVFIEAAYQVDPSTKFIFLIRDKDEFLASGKNRKWYETDHPLNKNRFPVPKAATPREKIKKLWCLKNAEILNQLSRVPAENFIFVSMGEFAIPEKIEAKIGNFIGEEIRPGFDWGVRHNSRRPRAKLFE